MTNTKQIKIFRVKKFVKFKESMAQESQCYIAERLVPEANLREVGSNTKYQHLEQGINFKPILQNE